LPQTVNN